MKLLILSLGLWLAAAQGFAAQACCSEMPTPKTAACDSCGSTDRESSSRPDCCTSLEAQKDVDLVALRNTQPEPPVLIELLPVDPSVAPLGTESTDLVLQQASFLAEGPPLYLRNSVLLI